MVQCHANHAIMENNLNTPIVLMYTNYKLLESKFFLTTHVNVICRITIHVD